MHVCTGGHAAQIDRLKACDLRGVTLHLCLHLHNRVSFDTTSPLHLPDVRAFAPRPPPAITHSRVWAGLRPKISYTWQNSANYNTNVARARKLVVFDFDHTMIGCDSGIYLRDPPPPCL